MTTPYQNKFLANNRCTEVDPRRHPDTSIEGQAKSANKATIHIELVSYREKFSYESGLVPPGRRQWQCWCMRMQSKSV